MVSYQTEKKTFMNKIDRFTAYFVLLKWDCFLWPNDWNFFKYQGFYYNIVLHGLLIDIENFFNLNARKFFYSIHKNLKLA